MIYSLHKKTSTFEKFFLKNYPRVKGFAFKLLKNEEDAEDVAQEIFIKIWEQPEIWESNQYKDSYIYTMTKNHIFNIFKKRLIQRKFNDHLKKEQENISAITIIEQEIHSKELALLYRMKIDSMPTQRKKVFKLSRFEGKSNQEIAKKLNLSVRTVERHIHLALKELKEISLFLIFLMF